MAVIRTNASPRPRWPTSPIDLARCEVRFGLPADELVLSFEPASRFVPSVSVSIDAPERDDAGVLIDDENGNVVGIHVYPLLAGAARAHPWWHALTEPNPSVHAFVAEVRDLFDRYWTPPPPIGEQFACLPRSGPVEGDERDA